MPGSSRRPVDSIATLVTPQALNQAARSCRSCVKVPKARTGISVLSGFTAAMCIVDPMSTAAAPGLTIFMSGWPLVFVLVMASPPFRQEGVGYASPSSS